VVYIPHHYQHPSHDPYLWQGSKYHQKGTLGTCGRVLRSWKVTLGLSGGPEEEYSPIGEDWGHDGVEIGLERREWERGEQS